MGSSPFTTANPRPASCSGSEIKALLRAPGLDRTLDAAALHQTLAYLWTPAPRTLLRSVRKLEHGSALIVSGGRVRRRWTYYSRPYDGQVSTASQAELAAELATRLETAVDRQLVSDVPVGAFLSGGLDSSAVVAMMRKVRPSRPITTLPGWTESTAGITDFAKLPENARRYLARIEQLAGVPIDIVSTGPDRAGTIVLRHPFD